MAAHMAMLRADEPAIPAPIGESDSVMTLRPRARNKLENAPHESKVGRGGEL